MMDKNIFPLSEPTKGAGGKTGTWRMLRPVFNAEKCVGCQLCWIYCPDAAIDRNTREINYDYCKGCGVCAKECPAGAIVMESEA